MKTRRESWFKSLSVVFDVPAPDPERARHRILVMERNVLLPVKIFFIAVLLHSFSNSGWVDNVSSTPAVAVETMQIVAWFYVPVSLMLALPLLLQRRMALAVLEWTVVAGSLVDALLISGMCVITGGVDSILYWLFIGLIVRNAVSIPPGFPQLFLNSATSAGYVLVAMLGSAIQTNTDLVTQQALADYGANEELGEPFLLRLLILCLLTASCHGVQALLERQRLALATAAEFMVRENQLRGTGRMAAEFAHQIKNPLAIINNCAHSLRRSVGDRPAARDQLAIIQEEVERVDQVIRQIMGYAQLSEGHVESLDLAAEIGRAVDQVFPAAVPTGIKVVRQLAPQLPPLVMQRGHLNTILVNLLQNAREALGDAGTVTVSASRLTGEQVRIAVADDGPGVPPEMVERVFEAYFTTKSKGNGLGLAIVRHNAELYGGTVRVESVLGTGAVFIVTLPIKALPKPFMP